MGQLLSMKRRLQSGVNGTPGSKMKIISSLAVLTGLFVVGFGPGTLRGAEEGVALAIVYDTSGSMKESVPDAAGGTSPKYVIANRALQAITHQLQLFVTNSAGGAPRKVQAGLFTFKGEHAREVVKLGPFDADAFESFAAGFSHPSGNTPLGNSLATAARAVLDSPLSRKHVLVITDGINTAGPAPQVVLPHLKKQAEQRHA